MITCVKHLGECLLKVTLQHVLMSPESRFSELLLSKNLFIPLQPIGLSEFCKKYGIAHTLGNRNTYLKNVCFHGFGEGSHQNILLGSEELHFPLR